VVKYQAYFVGADGQFTLRRAFACYTDEQAIEWTKQLMDERPAELRCGSRVVKRLSPPDDKQSITQPPLVI
jgi:hypothetical protein